MQFITIYPYIQTAFKYIRRSANENTRLDRYTFTYYIYLFILSNPNPCRLAFALVFHCFLRLIQFLRIQMVDKADVCTEYSGSDEKKKYI